jgi:hypothetical protein
MKIKIKIVKQQGSAAAYKVRPGKTDEQIEFHAANKIITKMNMKQETKLAQNGITTYIYS